METTLDPGERQVAPETRTAAAVTERELRDGFAAFQSAATRLTDSYEALRRRVAEMDIELAETNQRLRESLEEREAVLALLPVGVVATDSAGKVRFENAEARRILGEGDRRDLLTGDGSAIGVRVESSAVRTKIAPMPGGGRLVVLEDRSRIESLERQVQRLDRLAALSELSFGIAHELRNPLNAVAGFAGLLRRAKNLEQVETWGRKVEEGVRQVDEIVRNLLAFARPGAGKKAGTTPRELIREAMLSLAWSEDSVRLAGSALLTPLLTDPVAARQILSNLLRNALEAGGEGASISVEAQCTGGRMLVDVVDAGHGIPPELAPRIFDPFVTTKVRGTGLGLALCQRVAGYLDGHVSLVTTGPGGSRFRLDLPVGEAVADGG